MLTSCRRLLVMSLACVAIPACSPSPAPPPEASEAAAVPLPAEPPYIRGVITALERDGIRVEEVPEDRAGTAKAVLTLTPQTLLAHRSGRVALPTELQPGNPVSVWVEGPILESYPVQATARAIVLEPDQP